MSKEKVYWRLTTTNETVLINEGYYTFEEIATFEHNYLTKGYVVACRKASWPNETILEPENADDERKEKLMTYVMGLSNKDKAMALAWLTKRIRKIGLAEIWQFPQLKKIHEDLQDIYQSPWDLKDDIIVALRTEIKN